MWFKNLNVYRLTKTFNESAESLNEKLQAHQYTPCHAQQVQSMGWVAPISANAEQLTHSCQNAIMVCMKRQEKILPAAVINEQLEEKVREIENQEQRKLSRKERTSLKDEISFDLLPRAFAKSSTLYAYISPAENLLYINSASSSKAEDLINAIREAIGSFAVIPLAGKNTNLQTMTHWLEELSLPSVFTLGRECELKDFKDEGSVRCKNQDLLSDEVISHIKAGLVVKQVAITWQDKIECVIDDKLSIKRLKFSELVHEQADSQSDDAAAQFDADFAIMSSEFKDFISDLIQAFGGFSNINDNLADELIVAALKED